MSMSINFKRRTYGWIQNPSDFNKLKTTVQIFDNRSSHYQLLRDDWINQKIYFPQLRSSLQEKFNHAVEEFTYAELVGSSRNKNNESAAKRADAVANGLIQISLLPQTHKKTAKAYVDDWTSDGFLRWAVSLNFVEVDRKNDSFKITELGKQFSESDNDSEEQQEILITALLSYPPATRVLQILSDANEPKNKFYIGNRLGFIGESGFTSYGEEVMLDYLMEETDPKERTKIRSNVEGTSDKYARMICSWLNKLGLVKTQSVKKEGIALFQKYSITAKGIHRYNQSLGKSRHKKQAKFLMWEFLATDVSSVDYIRTRRAHLIKNLQKTSSANEIIKRMQYLGFYTEPAILNLDIEGLINFGLRIELDSDRIKLLDEIKDFDIPIVEVTEEISDIALQKEKAYFYKNTALSKRHISILEIAFDGSKNRDLEILSAEVFKDYYQLESIHLGGGLKPDGIAFNQNFGIIVDTKAYKGAYSRSRAEADKMFRYIEDNKKRDPKRNQSLWWRSFNEHIPANNFYFLWISGKFQRNFDTQINQLNYETGYRGGALSARQFLIGADAIQKGKIDINDLPSYFNNSVISFE